MTVFLTSKLLFSSCVRNMNGAIEAREVVLGILSGYLIFSEPAHEIDEPKNDPCSPIVQALAKEISKPLRLGRYKELEVSNILHGMALLKYYDQDCLDALGKAVVERNLEFPVHGLSTIINACGR